MNDNQKTLLSFVVGAAAGVAAGMLLAPYSGPEARRKITETANDLKSKAGDQWSNASEKLTSYVDSAVSAIAGNKTNTGVDTEGTATKNTTPRPTGQYS